MLNRTTFNKKLLFGLFVTFHYKIYAGHPREILANGTDYVQ